MRDDLTGAEVLRRIRGVEGARALAGSGGWSNSGVGWLKGSGSRHVAGSRALEGGSGRGKGAGSRAKLAILKRGGGCSLAAGIATSRDRAPCQPLPLPLQCPARPVRRPLAA